MDPNGDILRRKRESLGLSQAKLSELTGVEQYRLSAFELGKIDLPENIVRAIEKTLGDRKATEGITGRAKRYRNHEYRTVPHSSGRVHRARLTASNQDYLTQLDLIARYHERAKTDAPSAVSLFSGCGGFSLGFSAANFQLKGFLEVDPGISSIYRDNFPKARQLGSDIEKIDERALVDVAATLGPVDVLIGGPPCQGFSLAGKRRVDDPRNTLFRHYLRFVDALKPRLAFIENVRLLTSMKTSTGSFVRDDILREFSAHGYAVRMFEVNARDFGVPQHRERVFFVATRRDLGIEPSIPPPTYGTTADLFASRKPFRTFGDACSDLAYLESGDFSPDPLHCAISHPQHVIDWLWDVGEGCSAHENTDPAKRPPSGYNTTYKRQVWNEPAGTVQTTFGMISGCRNVHPIATRSLTIREAARIQSFPDSFRFAGTLGVIRSAIGNAVPPLLALALADHARRLLSDFVEVTSL